MKKDYILGNWQSFYQILKRNHFIILSVFIVLPLPIKAYIIFNVCKDTYFILKKQEL